MSAMEVWSLFSGAMGLDLGLESVGLRPSLAVEIDRAACETIRLNRPNVTLIPRDVSLLNAHDLLSIRGRFGDVDLMVGGPPCQSFSTGGTREALSDLRGSLIYEYLRLVQTVRPRFFVLENVANLVTAALHHRKIVDRPGQHWSLKRYSSSSVSDSTLGLDEDEQSGSAFRKIWADMQELDYHLVFGVLDAADYGAAQHRLRFLLIGSRRDDGRIAALPTPTHGTGSGLIPFRTLRDAIEDLQDSPGIHSEYTPSVRQYFDMVPEGGNWRSLPIDIQQEALGGSWHAGGGKTGFFRRLAWDSPAPTITGRANRKGSALCHPAESRPLSVRECARIQGFPDCWKFAGSMNAQYIQVGNAVPVDLGRAIGRAVLHADPSNRLPELDEMFEAAVEKLRSAARNKRPRQSARQLEFSL